MATLWRRYRYCAGLPQPQDIQPLILTRLERAPPRPARRGFEPGVPGPEPGSRCGYPPQPLDVDLDRLAPAVSAHRRRGLRGREIKGHGGYTGARVIRGKVAIPVVIVGAPLPLAPKPAAWTAAWISTSTTSSVRRG